MSLASFLMATNVIVPIARCILQNVNLSMQATGKEAVLVAGMMALPSVQYITLNAFLAVKYVSFYPFAKVPEPLLFLVQLKDKGSCYLEVVS